MLCTPCTCYWPFQVFGPFTINCMYNVHCTCTCSCTFVTSQHCTCTVYVYNSSFYLYCRCSGSSQSIQIFPSIRRWVRAGIVVFSLLTCSCLYSLLALGMDRYGSSAWKLIQQNLLPIKAPNQVSEPYKKIVELQKKIMYMCFSCI